MKKLILNAIRNDFNNKFSGETVRLIIAPSGDKLLTVGKDSGFVIQYQLIMSEIFFGIVAEFASNYDVLISHTEAGCIEIRE